MVLTLYQIIIGEIKPFTNFLYEQKKKSTSAAKKNLLGNLRALFLFFITILKDIKESEEIKYDFLLQSLKYPDKRIKITLKRSFVKKTLQRIFILESWNYFESFFQKEKNSDKIGKTLLEKYFGKNIPSEINFLRGMRNSLHWNGIYKNKWEPILAYKTNEFDYVLEYGKKTPSFNFDFMVDIIKRSLNSLK